MINDEGREQSAKSKEDEDGARDELESAQNRARCVCTLSLSLHILLENRLRGTCVYTDVLALPPARCTPLCGSLIAYSSVWLLKVLAGSRLLMLDLVLRGLSVT